MRKLIYALHLFAVGLLLFSKNIPAPKKAKLTFIMQRPTRESSFQPAVTEAKSTKVSSPSPKPASVPVEPKKIVKAAPPKPKAPEKKQVKETPSKKKSPAAKEKPAPKNTLVPEEKKTKELESLKKIESLLEQLQTPEVATPKKKQPSSRNNAMAKALASIQSTSLETSNIAFDGEGFQDLLFSELQLPQAGEVELELEIRDGSLYIAKMIQSQNEENLNYLRKKIPEIELGNCKKIAGLENGMRLRVIFCTKQI